MSAPPPRRKSLRPCAQNPSSAASSSSSRMSLISLPVMFSPQSQGLTLLWVSVQGFESECVLAWRVCLQCMHPVSVQRGRVSGASPGDWSCDPWGCAAAGTVGVPALDRGRSCTGSWSLSVTPSTQQKGHIQSQKSWVQGLFCSPYLRACR